MKSTMRSYDLPVVGQYFWMKFVPIGPKKAILDVVLVCNRYPCFYLVYICAIRMISAIVMIVRRAVIMSVREMVIIID